MAVRLEDARFASDYPHEGRLAAQTMSPLGGGAATPLRGLHVKLGQPEPVRARRLRRRRPPAVGAVHSVPRELRAGTPGPP